MFTWLKQVDIHFKGHFAHDVSKSGCTENVMHFTHVIWNILVRLAMSWSELMGKCGLLQIVTNKYVIFIKSCKCCDFFPQLVKLYMFIIQV